MIRGFFRGESPFVAARLGFPSVGVATGDIELLIDTGSHITVIEAAEIAALGYDLQRDFQGRPSERSITAGGPVIHSRVRASMAFRHDDGSTLEFRPFVRLSAAPEQEIRLPSVLGMDILSSFRLTVSMPESIVTLERL